MIVEGRVFENSTGDTVFQLKSMNSGMAEGWRLIIRRTAHDEVMLYEKDVRALAELLIYLPPKVETEPEDI